MPRIKAAITGVHGYVPPDVLTNADLERMVDTNDEWIRARTGIEERHILRDPNKATSDMAIEAVKGLLTKKGISPLDIDLVICATVTPDYFFPDTGTLICHAIGAKKCICLRYHCCLLRFSFFNDDCSENG